MLDHLDLKNSLGVLQALPPANVTADRTGSGVDLRDYEGDVLVVIDVGDQTSLVASVKLQESLNDNTANAEAAADAYADISGASLTPTFADNTNFKFVARLRAKRYVRAVVTFTSGSGIVGVTLVVPKRIL